MNSLFMNGVSSYSAVGLHRDLANVAIVNNNNRTYFETTGASALSQIRNLFDTSTYSDADLQDAWDRVNNSVRAIVNESPNQKLTGSLPNDLSSKNQSEKCFVLDAKGDPLFSTQIVFDDSTIYFIALNEVDKSIDKSLVVDRTTQKISNVLGHNYYLPLSVKDNSSANSANVQMTVAWLSVKFVEAKYEAISLTASKSSAKNKITVLSDDPNSPCLTHDLVCSNMEPIGIQRDGGWWLWFPCAGKFRVDVSSCCKTHDVAMWCSKNEVERVAADTAVVACVFGHVMDGVITAMPDICKVIGLLPAAIAFFAATVIFEALFLVGGIFYKAEYLNYDGRNSESCLCGGSKPTVKCDEPCRDLCIEFQRKETCFNCHWRCVYNEQYMPIGVEWVDAPPGQSCCPATSVDGCKPTREQALANCPKQCAICSTECGIKPRGGYGRYLVNPGIEDNLPCCKGTPVVSIKEPCPPPPDPFNYDYR